MVGDPISDMLIRIQNAGMAGHDSVKIPYSNMKKIVADLLAKEGFVKSAEVKGKGAKRSLEVSINYDESGEPKIKGLKKLSKPSRRIYKGYKDFKPVKFGHGTLVLSTPKGVMTYMDAKKEKVGGEALFEIW